MRARVVALACVVACKSTDDDVAAPTGDQWYTAKRIRYEGTLEGTGYAIELPARTAGEGVSSTEVQFNLNGATLKIVLDPETFDLETQIIQFVGWGYRKNMRTQETQPTGWLAVFDEDRQVARYVRLKGPDGTRNRLDGALVCQGAITDKTTPAKVEALTAICNSLTATTPRARESHLR